MIDLLQHISPDRVVTWLVALGTLLAQFKAARQSLRDQGRRIGALEKESTALKANNSALEARVAALEASGKRA